MRNIIAVNSLESNIGVTSTVLALAEKLEYMTKKSICVLELDYDNASISYLLEHENNSENSLDAIIPFLSGNSSFDEIKNVISFNKQSLKNANIDIIYSSLNKKLSENELKVLISSLSKIYDVILIDYGCSSLPNVIKEDIDMHLLIVQPSAKFIKKLSLNQNYIYDKTYLVINNSYDNLGAVKQLFKEKSIICDVIAELPASNTLVKNMFEGNISVSNGMYYKKLGKMTLTIAKKLNLDIVSKKSIFDSFKSINSKKDI